MPRPVGRIAGLVLAGLLLAPAAPAAAGEPVRFIALGDLPYPILGNPAPQQTRFDTEIAPAIRAAAPPFVIHYGDFKGGGERCGDALIAKRHDEIVNLIDGPVFYTPGDNDWTDCDRDGMSELERLDHLRRVFFAARPTLGDDWHYARQPNFPENARWRRGDVVFATVHLVGTNNGRDSIHADDVDLALALVEARDQADRVWLEAAFAAAEATAAGAVVVATQADVTKIDAEMPCGPDRRTNCDGFAGFRAELTRLAGSFGKPVLLLHGDTDPYCLDTGFGGAAAPKLWRLNATGDFAVVDATAITVTADGSPPFAIESLLGRQPPGPC